MNVPRRLFAIVFFAFLPALGISVQAATLPPHLHCSSGNNVPNVDLSSFSFDSGTSQITGRQTTALSVQLPLDSTFPELFQDVVAGTVFPACKLAAYGANGLTLYVVMNNAHFIDVGVSGFDAVQPSPSRVNLVVSFTSVQVETTP